MEDWKKLRLAAWVFCAERVHGCGAGLGSAGLGVTLIGAFSTDDAVCGSAGFSFSFFCTSTVAGAGAGVVELWPLTGPGPEELFWVARGREDL